MLKRIRRWYQGDVKISEPHIDGSVLIWPSRSTEYRPSANVARIVVGFYLRNWQWALGTTTGIVSIYVAVLALK